MELETGTTMPATESKARQDIHYPNGDPNVSLSKCIIIQMCTQMDPLCSSTTEPLQNPLLLHGKEIYSTDHCTGFHPHIALEWDFWTQESHSWRGEHSCLVFLKKNKEVPQANWSIIENRMTDWEEFKLTFVDSDLLQEGWTSSKKPLHHGLKCSTD